LCSVLGLQPELVVGPDLVEELERAGLGAVDALHLGAFEQDVDGVRA
jgi:hypothetical protein